VRFLVDQNRSPLLAELLRQSGHDAVYTEDIGLERAEDDEVLRIAQEQDRIVVSGDADFGALLALAHESKPSVILFRQRSRRHASQQAALLVEHLDTIATDLETGAIVVITDDRIRIRRLPLLPDA
jgi:predicted nuclease of predicted toxin-antitoxin system